MRLKEQLWMKIGMGCLVPGWNRLVLAVLFCFAAASFASGQEPQSPPATPQPPETKEIVFLGTGPVVGVYYPAGGAICSVINRKRSEEGIRCAVESTEGSGENITGLRNGDLHLAIIQSDWQHHALMGTGLYEEFGVFPELRSVFNLHIEAITIVTRKDANISALADLREKRVNIGMPGTAQRAITELLINRLGWKLSDLKGSAEISLERQNRALCEGEIDAYLVPVSHPNGMIDEVTRSCAAHLLDINGAAIDGLVEERPYFAKTTIPGGLYAGVTEEVKTFGLRATLVATTHLSEDTVYSLVKAVFEDFDRFRDSHPAFAGLTPEVMLGAGNTAAFHDGALRYYKERGWR